MLNKEEQGTENLKTNISYSCLIMSLKPCMLLEKETTVDCKVLINGRAAVTADIGFPPRSHGFALRAVHMGFLDKIVQG